MEKKEFKKPSMKVMNVQTETILAGSGVQSKDQAIMDQGGQGDVLFSASDFK